MRIPAPHVDVARVIPTLRAVLQQIDGADRKSHALNHGIRAARRQSGVRDKRKRLEWAAGTERPRTRKSIVDQMRALQVEATRSEIPEFQRSVAPQAFLHGSIPLLNVLRRRVRVEGRETYGRGRQRSDAEHGRAEIQAGVEESSRRSEVVSLLGFREDVRNVVALITPGIFDLPG